MSFPGPYRETQKRLDSDSEEELIRSYQPARAQQENNAETMNAAQIEAVIQAALASQEQRLRAEFAGQINAVNQQLQSLRIEAPEVESYQRVKVVPGAPQCDIPLHIVKSIPDFTGVQDEYVAWRQSATDAYELFESYEGSSARYQAVIRNKIKGPARALLVSYNTVLNFKAILARLDCSYADKTSLRLLRQGLESVRQGDQTLMQYYDEVERKLTLVTNKIVMTHDDERASLLNTEVRADALHVFISGLKKSLRSVVFPAQPKDLPAALALAREAEASIERSMFAATYAKVAEQRSQNADYHKGQHKAPEKQGKNSSADHGPEKNPHFFKKPNKYQNNDSWRKQDNWVDQGKQNQSQEPMDIDPSYSKFRNPTNFRQGNNTQYQNLQAPKRPNSSERMTGQRRQRVNHVEQTANAEETQDYENAATAALSAIDDDSVSFDGNDLVNFLEEGLACPSLSEGWRGKL